MALQKNETVKNEALCHPFEQIATSNKKLELSLILITLTTYLQGPRSESGRVTRPKEKKSKVEN